MGRLLVVVMLAACGRAHFDVLGDASPEAGFGAWSAPTEIPAAAGVDDPSITGDGLELFMNRGVVIEVSVRTAITEPWPAKVAVTVANMQYSPHISFDGLTLWGQSTGNILVATRATRTSAWSDATVVPNLRGTGADDGPSVTSDELVMVFDSTRTQPTGLFMATRATTTSPWSAPLPISEVNAAGGASRPQLTDDQLTIYFERATDIQIAHRASPTDPFDPSQPFTEANSAMLEMDPWISADQRHFVFESNRSGAPLFYEMFR